MREALLDWARAARTGVPEAVYCEGKTPAQIDAIIDEAAAARRRLLFTRLEAERHGALTRAAALAYDPLSRTAVLGGPGTAPVDRGAAVVAAGTSDAPVAREALKTLEFAGVAAPVHIDVGVAGLWRLTDCAESLADRRVVIAVAGFEGALFSVLAGLIRAPVIAVPRGVGFGVAEGGHAALHSALASCAPGVVAVNIDNGFGAACAALKILGAGPAADQKGDAA